jgi:hypothetical protein
MSNRPIRWLAGLENAKLLTAAETSKFDVVVTVDRGFEYQQNLKQRKIAVIIFCGKSDLLEDLLPLVPNCLAHLESIQPGQIVRIAGVISGTIGENKAKIVFAFCSPRW